MGARTSANGGGLRAVLTVAGALAVMACESAEPPPVPTEAAEAVCYDGFDNDDDGASDCGDSDCAGRRSCCIGEGLGACCEPPARVLNLTWDGCASTVLGCAPEVAEFGAPPPILVDGGIGASNSSIIPAGVYLTEPIDPRGADLELIFDVAAPECASTCANSIGFGLDPQPPLTGSFATRFALAVFIRLPVDGDQGGFVFLSGREVARFSVEDSEYHRYALALNARGTAALNEVDADGAFVREIVPEFNVDIADPSYVAMASQQLGAGETDLPGRVRAVELKRGLCDMPQRAFSESRPVGPIDVGLVGIDSVARMVNDAGDEAVLVSSDGAFHFHEVNDAGDYQLVGTLDAPALNVAMLGDATVQDISDPWLVANEEMERWDLYFTAVREDDDSVVGFVPGASGFAEGFEASLFEVVVSNDASFPQVGQPTVAEDLMVVRGAVFSIGSLILLRRSAGGRWQPSAGALADSVIFRPDIGGTRFFSRDLGHPGLVRHQDAWRLYFSGARGARRNIGLLVSDTGEGFRLPFDEPVWERLPGGFDSIVAFDPNPVVDGAQVRIMYLGLDGVRTRIGFASSGSPADWPSVDPFTTESR